jgi:hypothetical protein
MLDSSLSRLKGTIGNAEFDPDFDTIRDDPRFKKIIADAKKRLGIGGCAAAPVPSEATRTA